MITVEVAYALPSDQRLISLDLPSGATAREAIQQSGLLAEFPGLDPAESGIGIFSQPVDLDTALNDGDRVEIYRPLQIDPKAQRRARARTQRESRQG
ncbi:RnfH family protein [Spiribacter vilamensis]|nr:RnfH family protein [Spiribacter vilamensis]